MNTSHFESFLSPPAEDMGLGECRESRSFQSKNNVVFLLGAYNGP
jgi:hypothetical protein